MSSPQLELKDVWVRLWRHLERTRGFTLCLIFSSSAQATRALQERLDGALRWREAQLASVDPLATADGCDQVRQLLAQAQSTEIRSRVPLWLTLDLEPVPHAADIEVRRRSLLAALNAKRGVLESVFARPLIISLPHGYNATIWTTAPDLWTIRGFVGTLPDAAAALQPSAAPADAQSADAEPLPELAEWRRHADAESELASPAAAAVAVDAALRTGAYGTAEEVALQGLRLARIRHIRATGRDDAPSRVRDLALARDNLARVAQARGDMPRAEALYTESLQELRQLAVQIGTQQSLHDLALALNNVGRVAQAQEEWSQAQALYRESLLIMQQLATQLDTTPALLDLATTLDHVAQAARARHEYGEARAAYQESLQLSRQLAEKLATPQALRGLALALGNLGQMAQAQNDWAQAEITYREALQLSRQLAGQARTPDTLRDMVVALNHAGEAAQARGEWARAEALYRESLEMARELAERHRTSEALRDLSIALGNVGNAIQAQGEWPQAEALYRESLQLCRQLAERLRTPQALRELSLALNNAGRAAQAQGNLAHAEALLQESVDICRTLVSRAERSVTSRDDLGVALQGLGLAKLRNRNVESLREAERIYLQLVTEQPQDHELRRKLERVQRTLREGAAGQDFPL